MTQHPDPYNLSRDNVNKILEETQTEHLRNSLCLRCRHAIVRKITSDGLEYLTVFCRELGEDQSLNPVLVCSAFKEADAEAGASGSDSGTGGGERFEFLNEQPPVNTPPATTIARPSLDRLRAFRAEHADKPAPPPQAKPSRGF